MFLFKESQLKFCIPHGKKQKMEFENMLFYIFKAEIFSVSADWKVLALHPVKVAWPHVICVNLHLIPSAWLNLTQVLE